ncbi:hypothetical protein ACP70R_017468 [Stipagrostis hirtigluma subsp. patula]
MMAVEKGDRAARTTGMSRCSRCPVLTVVDDSTSLRSAPRGHPNCAVFHSNRAACLLQLRPVNHKTVAEECSLALQPELRFPQPLLRRALALEALGHRELAVADAFALLTLDPDHRDAVDLAHRLRSRLNASSAAASPAAPPPPPSAPRPSSPGLGRRGRR